MSEKKVVIVSAVRTPIGNFSGALSSLKASDLGAIVIKEALQRAKISPGEVSEVILGQSLLAGQGQNPARQASLQAGVPQEVPAYTINMLCGSGVKSVSLGYQSILLGDSEVVVCGGQESMSQAPHTVYMRPGVKMGDSTLKDSLLEDGLVDAMHHIHMGNTAENVAKKYGVTRQEQDEFSVRSQRKAEAAQKAGYFDKEIVPVEIASRKGTIVVSADEYPKHGTTMESLSKLKPCFEKDGTVTPGNASGVNDGAAVVVLTSSALAAARGLPVLGSLRGMVQVGLDPLLMGCGPVPAVTLLLKKVGWRLEEVDVFELNEAFAAQALAVLQQLGADPLKVNIHGGAIALGHPIGASGCRILVTLLHAMERTNGKKGVASLCVGGGMGVAIAVERD